MKTFRPISSTELFTRRQEGHRACKKHAPIIGSLFWGPAHTKVTLEKKTVCYLLTYVCREQSVESSRLQTVFQESM